MRVLKTIPLLTKLLFLIIKQYFGYRKMSFLTDHIKLKKVELTRELYEKHRAELLDMLVSQYFVKDPSSFSVNYETLFKYFQDEYDEIFTTDKS